MNWVGLYTFISREVGRTFRAWVQNLGAPWSGALLYILVFGHIVGQRISHIRGIPYIDFVLPGIVMMNMMASAFSHASFSVYIMKWTRSIDELLVAPFSYLEMIAGFVVGGVARAVVVGMGVYLMAIFFTSATIAHFWLMLFYAVTISVIFSFAGMLVALWSNTFEQLSLPTIFIITPLTFLGGVFNSIDMMPSGLQWVIRLNPFFYFVDGLRYAMVGIHESNIVLGIGLVLTLVIGLGFLVWYLFKIGYRIRE
ncbi:MAG: ABC transporter permease [Candidatus Ryanbacteria bacterium]|nr:ABC transporter permease [Candidatus Ryanbacteria bacterium]